MQALLLANATYAWFEGLGTAGSTVSSWTDIVAGEVASVAGSGLTVGSLNGKPAVAFNGSGNLATAAFAAGAIAQPFIIAAVFDWDVSIVFRYVHDGIASGNRASLYRDGTPKANILAGAAIVADNDFTLNPSYALSTYNGASSIFNLEGVTKTGNAGSNTLTGITIGALNGNGSRFNGKIAMLAIIAGANYATRGANVLAGLQSYYSFP